MVLRKEEKKHAAPKLARMLVAPNVADSIRPDGTNNYIFCVYAHAEFLCSVRTA